MSEVTEIEVYECEKHQCDHIERFTELTNGSYQKRCRQRPVIKVIAPGHKGGYCICEDHFPIYTLPTEDDTRIIHVMNWHDYVQTSEWKEQQPTFASPIEQAFWYAWHNIFYNPIQGGLPLEPQYQIGKYRVDFAQVRTKTVIELDGHATHSSPDAIAYDRKRERYIESQGWHVIRFGGKEIYSDANGCAREAQRLIHDRHMQQHPIRIKQEVLA